jgi:hypothetical protein
MLINLTNILKSAAKKLSKKEKEKVLNFFLYLSMLQTTTKQTSFIIKKN